MSLECRDNTWCHLLTSFLVGKDVKILWKCHDILMDFNRIFMRKSHSRKCHENVMKFQCHSMGLKMLVHFDGILMEKVHGIVMEFDVIFDQNSDGMKWWYFVIRVSIKSIYFFVIICFRFWIWLWNSSSQRSVDPSGSESTWTWLGNQNLTWTWR